MLCLHLPKFQFYLPKITLDNLRAKTEIVGKVVKFPLSVLSRRIAEHAISVDKKEIGVFP
jgi:hypothetical protein